MKNMLKNIFPYLVGIISLFLSVIITWWFQFRTLERDVDAVVLIILLSFTLSFTIYHFFCIFQGENK